MEGRARLQHTGSHLQGSEAMESHVPVLCSTDHAHESHQATGTITLIVEIYFGDEKLCSH